VSSPYILESEKCNMCERQVKNRDVYDKICTKQRIGVLTGQHRSNQSTHKATGVRAIWFKVIKPGLQAGLDHFAPFSQHKQSPFNSCITI
jgi:hypothetical protein